MILFCEECGQRNAVRVSPVMVESNGFTCQHCDFLSPFPFLDKEKKSTSKTTTLSWTPDALQYTSDSNSEINSLNLKFTVPDSAKPDLEVKPFRSFEDILTVEQASPTSFTVTLKSPDKLRRDVPDFNGPGLIYCESSTTTWGIIPLILERKKIPGETGGKEAPLTEKTSNEALLLQQLYRRDTQLQQLKDISGRMRKELSVTRQIMTYQHNGVLFINVREQIIYANPVFCTLTGVSMKNIRGKGLSYFVSLPKISKMSLDEVLHQSRQKGSWQGEGLLRSSSSTPLSCTVIITYTQADGEDKAEGLVCQFLQSEMLTGSASPESIEPDKKPIREEEESTADISRDRLTGLPDRPSFQHQLAADIEVAKEAKTQVGLVYVDLDHFKRINQLFGPGFGDKVLISISTMLQQCGDAAGSEFVARLSGDEFAVIVPPPAKPEKVQELVDRILDKFSHPFINEARHIFITPSLGVSIYPDNSENPLELLRNADTAMEMAKAKGGNRSSSWNATMNTQAVQNLHLEKDLRKAVADDGLINFYQPQVDMQTGAVIGMEALARWEHPIQGLMSPAVFIPIAESTGLIEKLGIDLVRQACVQGQEWRRLGYRKFTMAVNLSGRLLRRDDLYEQIMDCIESTGFPAENLEVEFTEGVLIENLDYTIELIRKWREKGIKMAIDDFGTGYSSLTYLQRFEVDKIKIDRSFIMNITENETDAAIVMGIIAIANKLGFKVIAEGIETEGHLKLLQGINCDEGQGFLFSQPVPADKMKTILLRDSSVALTHKRVTDRFYTILASDGL